MLAGRTPLLASWMSLTSWLLFTCGETVRSSMGGRVWCQLWAVSNSGRWMLLLVFLHSMKSRLFKFSSGWDALSLIFSSFLIRRRSVNKVASSFVQSIFNFSANLSANKSLWTFSVSGRYSSIVGGPEQVADGELARWPRTGEGYFISDEARRPWIQIEFGSAKNCRCFRALSWWEKKLGWANLDTTIAPFFAKNRTRWGKEQKYLWDLRISQVPPGGEGRHNLGEVPLVWGPIHVPGSEGGQPKRGGERRGGETLREPGIQLPPSYICRFLATTLVHSKNLLPAFPQAKLGFCNSFSPKTVSYAECLQTFDRSIFCPFTLGIYFLAYSILASCCSCATIVAKAATAPRRSVAPPHWSVSWPPCKSTNNRTRPTGPFGIWRLQKLRS